MEKKTSYLEASAERRGEYWYPLIVRHYVDGTADEIKDAYHIPLINKATALKYARISIAEHYQYGGVR